MSNRTEEPLDLHAELDRLREGARRQTLREERAKRTSPSRTCKALHRRVEMLTLYVQLDDFGHSAPLTRTAEKFGVSVARASQVIDLPLQRRRRTVLDKSVKLQLPSVLLDLLSEDMTGDRSRNEHVRQVIDEQLDLVDADESFSVRTESWYVPLSAEQIKRLVELAARGGAKNVPRHVVIAALLTRWAIDRR